VSDNVRTQLALKYRPAVFADVAGQRPSVALLYLMCKKGVVPGGMLFSGERGCGKTTMARIVAKALNCEAGPGKAAEWPCGKCPSCRAVDNGTHLDVEELDAASNGSVDQIRGVRERASYGPSAGAYKVYIVDEAHGLSASAFEAILKILEEPPPGVLFILCTTQPGSVPRTVRSRLSPFQFTPLPVAVIAARLRHICDAEGFDVEDALLTAIAEAASGGMRDAVNQLDQVASVGIGSLAMWQELTGQNDFAPVLLTAAANGNHAAMYAARDEALSASGDPGFVVRELVRCLADLLKLSCGGDIGMHGEALAARQSLIARLGAARTGAAVSVLWDLQTRVRADSREMTLTLALHMVSRCLCPQPAAPIAPDGSAPADYAAIRSALESV
jgi:DNA polymerase III subunit gamma/tau